MLNRLPTFVAIAFAMAAVGCGDSYDLHDEVAVGDIYRSVSNFSIRNGHLTVENAGQSAEFPMEMQADVITETDILKVDGGEPVRLKTTHIVEETSMKMEVPGEPVEEAPDHGALEGRSLLFEREGEKWKSRLVGGDPTEEQAIAIQDYGSPWLTNGIVPDHEVEVGDSWTIDGDQFKEWLGAGKGDASSGRVQVYFEQVVEYDGQSCVLLSVQVDASFQMPITSENSGTTSLSGEGFIYRSLSEKIDLYSKISGTARIEGDVFEQGQMIHTTISGPFVLEERITKY